MQQARVRQPARRDPVPVTIPAHGVFALESHHARDFQMKASRHDFLEIFYIQCGRGRFWLDGRVFSCRRGDVVVVPPNVEHQIEDEPETPLSLYGVCATTEVLRVDPCLGELLRPERIPCRRILERQIESDLRRLIFEQTYGRPGSSAIIVGIALEFLGRLARVAASHELPQCGERGDAEARALVRLYVRELDQHFFEQTDLDRVAERLGMSRRRFTQLFREETGVPWLRYVQKCRIQYACRLLEETRESVGSIAFSCGYANLSTFYRTFKLQCGVSPDRWRVKCRSRR
jgi:AraC-like DNA-binding protein/mannose-6-phosphate isomerase-like protein (cupin superfamily)